MPLPIPIDGIEIRLSHDMAGAKSAVRVGSGPIYVSPAMYTLLSKAETEAELRFLLRNIKVITLPDPVLSVPMTTTYPFKRG